MNLIRKYILFFIPVVAVLALPAWCLFEAGELMSIRRTVEAQQASGGLVGLAYSNRDGLYKLESARRAKPQILALGTSRMTQFRESLFPGKKFYNASRSFAKLEGLNQFTGKLFEDTVPERVILGLDAYFFHLQWPVDAEIMYYAPENAFTEGTKRGMTSWWRVYSGLINRKFTLDDLKKRDAKHIGMNAIANGKGFRSDGSYESGEDFHKRSIQERFQGALSDFEAESYYFRKANDPDEKELQRLDDFLSVCQSKGIHVDGFLTPYAHQIFELMKSRKDRSDYYFDLPARLKTMFEARGFAFHDFSDVAVLGMPDEEMSDGFHGSEKVAEAISRRLGPA